MTGRRIGLLIVVCFVIAVTTVLIGAGQVLTDSETPKAVYDECCSFRTQINEMDRQIRDIENQIEKTRKAVTNYEYVLEKNATVIAKLEQQAKSK